MYYTSARLNAAVRRSHSITSLVDIHDPQGNKIFGPLKVENGFVRVDGGRDIRRRFTSRLIDYTGTLTPREATDLLHPLARNEFRAYRGVVFGPDDYELVPQGVFDMSDVSISDSKEGFRMEVQGFDRARDVQRRRFVTNYHIPAGSNYGDAIQNMISNQRPGTAFAFDDVVYVTPDLTFGGNENTGGGNAWDAGQKMAKSIGHDLYFDVDGVCRLKPVTSLDSAFVHWHYHEAEDEPSQLLYVDRKLSDEETRNHIIVFGQSTSNDVHVKGEAWDDDPNSPTFIDGPFGDIPGFERSEFIRTTDQANEFARAVLARKIGIEETVRITSIVHPGHEIGDIIHIKRDRSGVDSNYIVDQFTMPLEASQALNISVRRKQ